MRNITKEEHFTRSLETSEHVLPLIEEAVAASCAKVPSFKSQCDVFLHRRRNAVINKRPMLRPYLARVLYELGGGENWKDVAAAFAAVELHNISTYQTNLSFDGKIDWPHAQTTSHNQVMASMLSIAAAHELLEGLRPGQMSSDAVARASWRFHNANGTVYLGQYLDLNVLKASSVEEVAEWDETAYLQQYLQRCRLMGGGTFTTVLIGYYFSPSGEDREVEKILESYLSLLGMGTQLTNDLGDYYLNESRPYSASFMDLRRGRLTLPTFRLLKDGCPSACDLLGSYAPAVEGAYNACIVSLQELGIYKETKDILERVVWCGISTALKQLREYGIGESALAPLTFARPFLFNTKYLRNMKSSDTRSKQKA